MFSNQIEINHFYILHLYNYSKNIVKLYIIFLSIVKFFIMYCSVIIKLFINEF